MTLRRRARLGGTGRGGHQDPQPLPRLPDVQRADGRHPPQGHPVRGPAGHRQDLHGQGHGAEAGVPFLFVSSSAFQSMFYGQTNRKIRSYFKELRRQARREGGAIGFIEEIDAIGGAARLRPEPGRGDPRGGQRAADPAPVLRADAVVASACRGKVVEWVNGWLPDGPPAPQAPAAPANILVIGATNRAADLDPALIRPGRFDRTIYFDLPGRAGRRDILDYYLGKQGPRARARRPGAPRHPGGHDGRLLAGDARAPARRGAGVGAAPRRATACRGTTSSRPR